MTLQIQDINHINYFYSGLFLLFLDPDSLDIVENISFCVQHKGGYIMSELSF